MRENEVSAVVLDAAISVHRVLGPGLLESVYEVALAHVLRQRRLHVIRQMPISITFEGITFDEGFRADLIVESLVLIELKSLERVAPVHRKVVLTYLRLSGLRLGLLINFGAPVLKDGYERLVNGLDDQDRAESAENAEIRHRQGATGGVCAGGSPAHVGGESDSPSAIAISAAVY